MTSSTDFASRSSIDADSSNPARSHARGQVADAVRAMPTPNLFILGAGKCGTTSLHHILNQHPDIHCCQPKEPSFFCSHFQVVSNPIEYFRLFDSPVQYRVDPSHVYFSNPESAPVLKSLFPRARFILIFRDPIRRAYSLYRHMRRTMHEDGRPQELLGSFLEALQAESDRFESKRFLKTCRQYFWNFMYVRSTLYDVQLSRYLKLFERDQFFVCSLAELSQDPLGLTRQFASFLTLDPSPFEQADFNIKNASGADEAPCRQSQAMLATAFNGLTQRVDDLVGRKIDWSL